MTASACPSPEMLSAFADHELTAGEALAVQTHLAACVRCREEVLDWIALEENAVDAFAGCLGSETLVAYAENALAEAERIRATEHLATCARCRSEIESMRAAPGVGRSAVTTDGPSWGARVVAAAAAFGRALARPGPVLSAVTAAALLVIALTQLWPPSMHPGRLNPQSASVDVRHKDSSADGAPRVLGLRDAGRGDRQGETGIDTLTKREGESDLSRSLAAQPPAPPPAPPAAAFDRLQPAAEAPERTQRKIAPATRGRTQTEQEAHGQLERERQEAVASAARTRSLGAASEGAPTPTLLTVRAGPSDDSPIVASVPAGALIARVKDQNGWTQVALASRRFCWVRSTEVPANLPQYHPPAAALE